MRRRRTVPFVLVTLAVAVVVGVVTTVVVLHGRKGSGAKDAASASARDFLAAWARSDVDAASSATDDPAAARTALGGALTALSPTKATLTPTTTTLRDGDRRAQVGFDASWTLAGVERPWTYRGQLVLARTGDTWKVTWSPSVIHPKLGAGDTLDVKRTQPERAAILDASGQPLFQKTAVVTVGIQPSRVTDLHGLADTLATTLKISATDIVTDVGKAKPDQFVPVITLREADYQRVRPVIHDLPGTVFQTGERVLGPTAHFAQPLLGRVGEVTAEMLKSSKGAYAPGDQVGLSGLQLALNAKLTGRDGVVISTRAGGDGSSANADGATLATIPGTPGTPVTLTLDRKVQAAADQAVENLPKNAAIVAIRPSTGAVLAVSNGPKATFDLALSGQVPAGSTFKIITATSELDAGLVEPDATVGCPGTITVDGRTFHNENSFDLGTVPVRTAFAHSCNTTFIGLARTLDPAVFARTAASFGIGAGWTMPVTSFSGSVSPPTTGAERAADAIGQGKVQVSPFAMALVAATVQHGSTPTPVLVSGSPATPKHAPAPPPAAALSSVRDFMRAVVTDGTAKDLASLPGDIAGKTGTAEYGTDTPPRSHAWFAGYRGDLAFAVFVEDGESSHTTAVPVARTFLTALGG